MKLTGAEIICECLLEQKVNTVFGYPGGAALNTYDALYKYSDRINHILTAHEQGASHAADGYARSTGKTGVVLTTSGPGATNIVTGLATANIDSIPMVAITANVNTDQLGRDSFQEVNIVEIAKPVQHRPARQRQLSGGQHRRDRKARHQSELARQEHRGSCSFYPQGV